MMPDTLDSSYFATIDSRISINDQILKGFEIMATARAMADIYEENKTLTSKYVHACSNGHEAIQIAAGMLLQSQDYAAPYYRDDALLLSIGMEPYELMLQLMAKADDPFSGGRTYYSHPSLRRDNQPKIPHQSSATGMQAIPAAGMAHGIKYLESVGLHDKKGIVLCSLGDGSVTEGEVAEAFQMAVLKSLPIVFLIQDNGWSISAHIDEFRKGDAFDYAAGFQGLERRRVDGTDLTECFAVMQEAYSIARQDRSPVLVHASVPLLGHHTSGVRREWYRGENLDIAKEQDPFLKLQKQLVQSGMDFADIEGVLVKTRKRVEADFEKAKSSPDPDPTTVLDHVLAPTTVLEESGERNPASGERTLMVDAALHAVDEILKVYPEALFYGQDVGARLGGVFREAATLAQKYGDHRVFNTPIQEAYIIGSTAGMSAVGAKPIVEVQFADYIWTGMNQLVVELAKSCYLTNGKYPVSSVIRIPTGAYGSGGPYHSGSVESTLLNIRGIKVCYPSNAADLKGLMKAAYLDPNPVVMLEHKGLYWSKIVGTEEAKCIEPGEDYILPLGNANIVLQAHQDAVDEGTSVAVITYGMGVYWAKAAAQQFDRQIEIVDLRTLYPLDESLVMQVAKKHGKVLVLTEEPLLNSFAESLAHRIAHQCFRFLDAPVETLGSLPVPAIPLNQNLEAAVLPNVEKVATLLGKLASY